MAVTIQPIEDQLLKAITRQIETIVNEEAAEAAKRVERRVRQDASIIAVSLLKHFTMERFSNQLVIRVDFENTKT